MDTSNRTPQVSVLIEAHQVLARSDSSERGRGNTGVAVAGPLHPAPALPRPAAAELPAARLRSALTKSAGLLRFALRLSLSLHAECDSDVTI